MTRQAPIRALACAAAAFALAACGSQVALGAGEGAGASAPVETDPAVAIDGWWLLRAGSLDGVPLDVGNRRVTLGVDDGEAAARAECNYFGGTAHIEGSSITIVGWEGTEMSCYELMSLESAYVDALQAAETYLRSGDELVLSGESTELRFEALPPLDTDALVDRRWVIESLSKDGMDIPIVDRGGFVELRPDGSYEASTGACEHFGSYVVEGDHIRMTSQAIRETACPYNTGRQDGHVFAAYGGEFEPVLDSGMLTITGEGGETVVHREGSPAG